MTRRVVKNTALDWLQDAGFSPDFVADPNNNLCPYGKLGDIIWVRETWVNVGHNNCQDGAEDFDSVVYKASQNGMDWEGNAEGWRWKPSIFMPKDASRIWLEVTNIRVERLHDISVSDIKNEGVRYPVGKPDKDGFVYPLFKLGIDNSALSFMPENRKELSKEAYEDALFRAHWAELWCQINGRERWSANPWVWVIEFKVLSTTGKDSIPNLTGAIATEVQ